MKFFDKSETMAWLPTGADTPPIRVFGTDAIRKTFDMKCLQQAVNSRLAPGITEFVLNPDAHCGYGAPVGCVMISPTHIYPGPVGVDIKCSMSLLQMDIPAIDIQSREIRRQLINAICERLPTGAGKGQQSVKKSRHVEPGTGVKAVVEGASASVLSNLGIPTAWADACEDAAHLGAHGSSEALIDRLNFHLQQGTFRDVQTKFQQLGSYGGGNHFGECEVVHLAKDPAKRAIAESLGLENNRVAFLSHCGSRGFGHNLAMHQFRTLQKKFADEKIPLPGNDRELVYAELGSAEADNYLDDMSLGANFATVNHLLINALVLEAFQEVLPGTQGQLIYFISHNIARMERMNGQDVWVHRKGATRAFPAGHAALAGTRFATTGHPILLPGNPQAGSAVMVARPGAKESCYTVNHGAGRVMGRRHAQRVLSQKVIDESFNDADILTNCRQYPKDEAPAAYKDFNEVLKSVEEAELATEVARLKARFVIKDGNSPADD
jgi:tRNA-splicing ligase RtcB